MKILIVDDNKTSLDKLGAILIKAGHDVTSVDGGKDALDKYRKEVFDIVFIGWTINDMGGIGLCSDIKDLNILRQRDSYLIMTTGRSNKRNMVEAMEAGADDFILKPYSASVVKSRIDIGKRVLDMRMSDDSSKKPGPVEILEKEHELIHRITGILDMTSNMLGESRPIPEKLLTWCTSSVFLLSFHLHERKENYYIERFIERAKEAHGQTSQLFTRSSLTQIMREHELIEKLIMDMQNVMTSSKANGKLDVKKLKGYIL